MKPPFPIDNRTVQPISFALLFLLCGVLGCVAPREPSQPVQEEDDHILAIVGGNAVTTREFERQYSRTSNTGPVSHTRADHEDFLQRYVNYKLKVLEARRLGYHERPDVEEEIRNYRSQLVRPYLLGKEVTGPLLEELYERRTEAVDISHILLSVPANAPPQDTIRAYSKLSAIRDSISSPEDFYALAVRHSGDPSATLDPQGVGYGGRLGFFGGGKLVKSFEDQAFVTSVGDVSPVFRSPFGYHILYVHDRKAMPAERRLAHIMIRTGTTATPNEIDIAAAESRIRAVKERLDEGDPFDEVARDLSDDRNSAQNGGDLGFVAYDAGLPPDMQKAAWDLTSPGTVAGPVKTRFGTHFLTYLEERPLGSFEEEEERLNELLRTLPRLEEAESEFAARLVDSLGMSIDSSIVSGWVQTMEPDSLYLTLYQNRLPDTELERTLVSLGDSTYTVSRFGRWFGQNPTNADLPTEERLFSAIRDFVEEHAIDYEVAALENRDAEFRQTMQEFRDGMILFRLMEDSVWTAASEDTTGLRALYLSSQDTLRFGNRIRAISLTTSSMESLTSIVRQIREGSDLAHALEQAYTDSTFRVRVDTTLVEAPGGSAFDGVFNLNEGQVMDPVPYQNGAMTLFHAGIEPARAKTFQEARPDLIGVHQENVEQALLERLRNRYNVRVWPERLDGVFTSDNSEGNGS